MLNAGVGALPTTLVLQLPSGLKVSRASLEIYKHVSSTFNTMSNQAAAFMFLDPGAVTLKNRHMLMAVIQQWKEYRAMLILAGMAQSDIMCTLLLEKIYALLLVVSNPRIVGIMQSLF
jgi:hypothetical protein